jgi:anti-sigma-K factor RskA
MQPNGPMRCDDVEELAGAYALHALPLDEMAGVETHLAGCERHPELAELLATAAALSMTAPEMEPPAALKTRLMAAVRAEQPDTIARPREPRRGFLERVKGMLARPQLGYGLAAAMAAVAVAVVIATSSGGDEGTDTVVRTFSERGVSGRVIYIPDEETAVMQVQGMEPAPEGRVYQIWAITDGGPASIGFFTDVPEDGPASSAMSNITLEAGQTVAVTLEPAGGSPQPTTDPLFGVEF